MCRAELMAAPQLRTVQAEVHATGSPMSSGLPVPARPLHDRPTGLRSYSAASVLMMGGMAGVRRAMGAALNSLAPAMSFRFMPI